MTYRGDCIWLRHTVKGRKCLKRATTMEGCPNDCLLYEKK